MKAFALVFFVVIISSNLQAQRADFESTDFTKADSIAALYPNHSLKDLRSLANKLTTPLSTEIEKFRSIYTWICNNIENDYALYLENKVKREKLKSPEEFNAWNKKFGVRIFKTLINEQKTVCSGYAYLVKELASYAALSCVVVNGYGRTVQANIGGSGTANHTWNGIQLNNKWYLCDATWSSGSIDADLRGFVKKYDDSYFLADPSLFVRSHYPLDSTWLLFSNAPTLQAFLNGPLIYRGAFSNNVNPLLPETFEVATTKGKIISFRFRKSGDKEIEKGELHIVKAGNTHSVSPPLYQDTTGLYCMDYIFTTKGTHLVHILLNSNYAFTYTVKVK